MPQERPTVQQLAAEKYITKRETYAREIAARQGVPYGSEQIGDDRAYELFYRMAPEAQADPTYEQRMWLEAAAAVAAGALDPTKVTSYVVEKVYPDRIAVTEGGGRLSLKQKTDFVNRMVKRRQREQGTDQPAEQTTPAPSPEGMGY